MDESQIERPFSSRFVVIFTVPRLLAALADHDVALTPRRLAQTRQHNRRHAPFIPASLPPRHSALPPHQQEPSSSPAHPPSHRVSTQ